MVIHQLVGMDGMPSAMMEVESLADTRHSWGSNCSDNVGGLLLKCGSIGSTGMLEEVSAEVPVA